MLRSVSIKNYKAIGPGDLKLDLAPLTVLVGKNGTGKSSILEAIALTAQSAMNTERRRDLVLSGDLIDIPHEAAEGKDSEATIYYGAKGEGELSCGIDVDLDSSKLDGPLTHVMKEWLKATIGGASKVSVGYSWHRKHHRFPQWAHEYKVACKPALRVESRIESESGTGISSGQFVRFPWRDTREFRGFFQQSFDTVLPPNLLANIDHNNFMPKNAQNAKAFQAADFVLQAIDGAIRETLSRIGFLSALRGRQLMHHEVGPEVRFAGKHGDMTIRLLSDIQKQSDKRQTSLRNWALKFGLKDLVAGWAGEQLLKVTYRDEPSGAKLTLDAAAGGAINGLMLATQLLFTPEGSCLLIEEPEVSMNPGFERLLPELFAEAVGLGKQVIAVTHSEVLIAALGNAVRSGAKGITPEQVVIHELSRDPDGRVASKRLSISDKGYLDSWVASFSEVERGLFHEWAESLPEARDAAGRGYSTAGSGDKGKRKPGRPKRPNTKRR
jgi:energy-coupling factor transporter ATP-binding protein EcfA2